MAHGMNTLTYRERAALEPLVREHEGSKSAHEVAQLASQFLKRPVTAANIYGIREALGIIAARRRRILTPEDIQRIEDQLEANGRVVVFKHNGHKLRLEKLETSARNFNRFTQGKVWSYRKKAKAPAVTTDAPNGLDHAGTPHS